MHERLIVSPDTHGFVGRIFDLSIVSLYFETDAEIEKYPDAKYVLGVNNRVSLLVSRAESLNNVGNLLWPETAIDLKSLPISAYEFCRFIEDSFLMRAVSLLDCCCLLSVVVFEFDLRPRDATIDKIKKLIPGHEICDRLQAISDFQFELRGERNLRFHRAEETYLTDDDLTFKTAALFNHRGPGMIGTDRHGREIDVNRFFNEAIEGLRDKFKKSIGGITELLDPLYDVLSEEFESRFKPKFRHETGFGRIHGVFGS